MDPNAAVAGVFEEIADYLELAGDNPFKIRAYRRAAEAIANLEGPVEELSENGQLENVEGMGTATVAKTKEFLATGQVRLLQYLRSQYPPGLLDVLRVQGLGPKKVALLYKERGIDSLEKFIEALNNNGLAGLSGFGPKTIENLKTSIRRMAEMSARLPIPNALFQAGKLRIALADGDTRVEIAGSLRRGADTVGNLNLVAGTNAATVVLDRFEKLPGVLAVLERGEDFALAKVHPGLEVEVICTPPERFGSTLFFRTGSRPHVEAAQAFGVNLENFAEEAEVYAALAVPFIEPELRENLGEWEAAKAGKLPNLVRESDLRGDLHNHSTWSDGSATIRQMAEAAIARGYQYLAITDHSKALAMANGLDAKRLREQAKEIAEVQAEFPQLKLLRGVECDIMRDGSMDLDDEILSELDIVVASVHSAFNLDEVTQTERMIKALSNPHVDIVAHPTGRVLGVRPPYDVNVPALIAAAQATGTAMEINASERLDLKDSHAYVARELGVLLAIDTDAHSQRMLSNAVFGVLTARRAWCEARHILNTKPVNELLAWLKR